MSNLVNYSYSVQYALYTIKDGERVLEEETTADQPFNFMTGFGTTLDAFEANLLPLNEGETFDFTLPASEGYGDYHDDYILMLEKSMFEINGKFDVENIFVDAIVPLQNADGQRFLGRVLEITDDKVKMDLNHPLAGKDLNFIGKVVAKREATNKEIEAMIAHLTGNGCKGGCGGCGGGCNGGSCGEGGCGGCK